ncbi:ALBINO3-like protein 2, chloroplastic [Senna tora]|uniref:ALBINO3-like protein 2, chloroplastic n=1 Tax=Senna tora TaxID=362788 RepID=A0A834WCP8_9FABA|nr:ALBINO3-like protein 2, chloroplastic [Senna tora]
MATSVLSSHFRRSRPSSLLPFLAQLINPSRLPLPPHATLPSPPFDTCTSHFRTRFNSQVLLGNFHLRAFSTFLPDDDSETGQLGDNLGSELQVESELLNGIDQLTAVGSSGDDSIFPVRAVISMLDGFHDLTGLPCVTMPSASLEIPATDYIYQSSIFLIQLLLDPLIDSQVDDHSFLYFRSQNRTTSAANFTTSQVTKDSRVSPYILLFLHFAQLGHGYVYDLVLDFLSLVPCFFLWMISIRRMSLDGHPGFNCGGALWFQDLTELPHGWSGFIFPLLIAGLHHANVKICLKKIVGQEGSFVAFLADLNKWSLEFQMLPIALIGFALPQQLTLRHPTVLAKLGLQHNNSKKEDSEKSGAPKMIPLDSTVLQDKSIPITASEETSASKTASSDSPEKWFKIPAENLSPRELTAISGQLQSNGDNESAILLLRLALDKDAEYVRALVLMGRFLLQKKLNAEAMEYFERAISKLCLAGQPTEVEDVDLLILASQWAGVACERQVKLKLLVYVKALGHFVFEQGKRVEGLVHFERVANLEEPEDAACKAHYFDGLLLLASTLYDAGQKDEAAKYLRLVVAYNPAYTKFLEVCERQG